jgi:o-succinylbenzoate synthase
MYQASFKKYTLTFKKVARTSRNQLQTHTVYYIQLKRLSDGKITYGEAAPLKGLSIDDVPDIEQHIQNFCNEINNGVDIRELDFTPFPSVAFAFETASLAMSFNQPFQLFDTPFYHHQQPIKINGLVWMNDIETMLDEAFQKAQSGFDVIKFKVGAHDFDAECRMLEQFRKRFNAFNIEIRLDANGAFAVDDAIQKLKDLSRFDIHSIEQPIKAKQWEAMQQVCAESNISIALDEELIGVDVDANGFTMLNQTKPSYIILKPTLVGGLAKSNTWIKYANKLNIGWWATSALESNVGLNAICQWASTHHLQLPQGLGTGSLYHNNIESPLLVSNGTICYSSQAWDEALLASMFQ